MWRKNNRTMEEKSKEDVKKAEETAGDGSTQKETPLKESEAVKTHEEKADELLGATRKVEVPRFNEINDKAKLYEKYEPLIGRILSKVSEKPDFVDDLLGGKKEDPVEERLARLEDERKAEQRGQLRGAITEALSRWPDFEKSWKSVQPIVESLYKSGVSYPEAIRRGYLAINPDAAKAESERIAQDQANKLGEFKQGSGGRVPHVGQIKNDKKLTPGEQRAAKINNMTDEQYASALERLEPYLKAKGFYDPILETPLE